ncbi:MAG: acyl-CoA dehydrogenase family protein [Alphaproteobacteria bacterium]
MVSMTASDTAIERAPTSDLAARMGAFAAAHIAPRETLSFTDDFPFDLWEAMGADGLLTPNLPAAFGGEDASHTELLRAGYELVRRGHCLGIAVCWQAHALKARVLFHDCANDAQRRNWLPKLASGALRTAMAISEPGAGAHPKKLATEAVRDGENYVITGEKAYLTNGPIADLFTIFAITGRDGDRKRFSAFLVPRETQGVTLLESGALDYLKPSLHCGLRLDGCRVPATAMIGPEGGAFEALSRPFRELEDTLMMGPLLGGLELLLAGVAARAGPMGDDDRETVGGLVALGTAMHATARRAAEKLDAGRMEEAGFPAYALAFRDLARQFLDTVAALRERLEIGADRVLDTLARDLIKSVDIARYAQRLKQQKLSTLALEEEK